MYRGPFPPSNAAHSIFVLPAPAYRSQKDTFLTFSFLREQRSDRILFTPSV